MFSAVGYAIVIVFSLITILNIFLVFNTQITIPEEPQCPHSHVDIDHLVSKHLKSNPQISNHFNDPELLQELTIDLRQRLLHYHDISSPLAPPSTCILQKDIMTDCFYNLTLTKISKKNKKIFSVQRQCDFFSIMIDITELTWRFSCSIESASILHPKNTICIFHENDIKKSTLKMYEKYRNVKWVKFRRSEAFYHTPMHFFWEHHVNEWGEFGYNGITHLKEMHDAIRWAIFYKLGGGVYFDLDNVFIKSFENFEKDTIFQSQLNLSEHIHAIGAAPIVLMYESLFLKLLVHRYTGWYQGKKSLWASMGPGLITKTWKMFPLELKETIDVAPIEKGIFFNFSDWESPLENVNSNRGKELYRAMHERSYTLHLWRYSFEHEDGSGWNSKKMKKLDENSFISRVFKEQCPNAYVMSFLPFVRRWNRGK